MGKIRTTEIHPNDAFYPARVYIVGEIGRFSPKTHGPAPKYPGYEEGTIIFNRDVAVCGDIEPERLYESAYFLAVKTEPVEE
jgi:hypothetical protein